MANFGATTQSDDVRDNGRWGEHGTGRTSETWHQCLVDDLKSVSSYRRVYGTHAVGVWS